MKQIDKLRNIAHFALISLLTLSAHSQTADGITFELEKLEAPANHLATKNIEEIYTHLSSIDFKIDNTAAKDICELSPLCTHSFGNDRIVGDFGYNSFFFGLCEAYSHHRPIVLSPDIIWILICQGFANHINSDSEQYRNQIVDFEGRKQLSVTVDSPSDDIDWYNVIESYYHDLSIETKDGLADNMICEFSTSGAVERMVSQVSLMEAVKAYYEFIVIHSICGIPSVTLQGAVSDWELVREKALKLEKYGLGWWTDKLEPILNEFVNASKGNADIDYWKRMIHITEPEQCGDSRIIDGWITDFYPYDKNGNRLDGGRITNADELPSEIVKMKVHKRYEGNEYAETDLNYEIWAGIFGLDQNDSTFALRPRIGWFVREVDQNALDRMLFTEANSPDSFYGIKISVDSIPSVLMDFEHIYKLDMTFKDKAFLPEWMRDIQIDYLILRGKVPVKERMKARAWFENVEINPGSHYPVWFKKLFLMGH